MQLLESATFSHDGKVFMERSIFYNSFYSCLLYMITLKLQL